MDEATQEFIRAAIKEEAQRRGQADADAQAEAMRIAFENDRARITALEAQVARLELALADPDVAAG